jgi:hypothetical protein
LLALAVLRFVAMIHLRVSPQFLVAGVRKHITRQRHADA